MTRRATWQLPPGVHRGTWDYLTSDKIAHDYDDYFASHPLLECDLEFILEHLPRASEDQHEQPIIVDLGCGSGRVALRLASLGYRCLNVDLSMGMLRIATEKLVANARETCAVRANMVELDCIRSNSADGMVCLFSSFGMIRGRTNRQACLRHCRRILRPDGVLILHVHNLMRDLWEPGGWRRLLTAGWSRLTCGETELGDTVYGYRGLPAMFMHRFRRGELASDLARAGFGSSRFFPLHTTSDRWSNHCSWWHCLRAGSFFVVARE